MNPNQPHNKSSSQSQSSKQPSKNSSESHNKSINPQQQHQQQQQGFSQGQQGQYYQQQNPNHPPQRGMPNPHQGQQFSQVQGQRYPPKQYLDSSSSHNNSRNQSLQSLNQPARNTIEHKYKLLPRLQDFKPLEITARKGYYLTNYFQYRQNHSQKDNIYLYIVQTRPTIPPDSHDIWYRLIRSASKRLNKEIGVITFRGNTIWAKFKKVNPFTLSTAVKGPKDTNIPPTQYQILIKMTKVISLEDLYKSQDSAAKPLFTQMVNNTIKQRMHQLGFFQLGKGRFYSNNQLVKEQQNMIKSKGLTIMKGFRFTFITLGPKRSFLQIDTCSRILRTENFYETLIHTPGTQMQKKMTFKGATLLARYGNHKTYTLQEIDFSMTPLNTFSIRQNNQQIHISFASYLQKCYGIKITSNNQPMIKAIAKVQKKIQKGKKFVKTPQAIFLIPQFMILTGMSDRQRGSHTTMQEVAKVTRTEPAQRKKRIDALSQMINNQHIRIDSMARMQGYKLQPPFIRAKADYQIDQYGNFDFKGVIRQQKIFVANEWGMAFSTKSLGQYNLCYDLLRQSGEIYGIILDEPVYMRIQPGKWNQSIKAYFDQYFAKNQRKLKLILIILNDSEINEYNRIKAFCTKVLKIKTQFARSSTILIKGLSACSKILLQMAAKQGNKLWIVPKNHKYWANKRVALASISYSMTFKNSFTIALVGTTDDELSSVYSYSMMGLSRKDQIGAQIYRNFFFQWLYNYYNKEKTLPDTLIIYRQGLSDVQIKKTIQDQIENLYLAINYFKSKDNFKNYCPEIAFFTVNKRVNSKFYDFKSKATNQFSNPSPGSVIFCQMASNNLIDFYLIPQKVDDQIGTAMPTQYKLAYYKAFGQKEDAKATEKVDLPLHAIAQLTFEQCFNYYNWHGAIKIPSVLQCGDKLSTLVGEHIQQNVNYIDFQNSDKKIAGQFKQADKMAKYKQLTLESNAILNSFYFLQQVQSNNQENKQQQVLRFQEKSKLSMLSI